MRRKGSDIYAPARLSALEEATAHLTPEALVDALAPHVTDARAARLRDVFAARLGSVTVLMDAPYDPHNGSAVMRTLDAFGVEELHVVERGKPFLAHASVARGAHKWIDVRTYDAPGRALETLRGRDFELVATHPDGELRPEDLAAIPRLCIVMGNERTGIADDLAAACTRRVSVPMRGFVESLNVSVTAAILLHGATRRRVGDLSPARRLELFARGLLLSVERADEILMERGLLPHAPTRKAQPHPNAQGGWKPPKPKPSLRAHESASMRSIGTRARSRSASLISIRGSRSRSAR